MIYIFGVFAAIQIWFSFVSLKSGLAFYGFVQKELASTLSDLTCKVSLFIPCKGVDQGLRENLQAIFDQQYADYEIIFAVDDEADPAVAAIRSLIEQNATPAKLVIAEKALISGQKVENLRKAVLYADPLSKVFVFTDSDTRPEREWLARIVAPLEREGIGGASGYRWFIAPKPTFASELQSVWNASIATTQGADPRKNFCWGGSMAVSRDTFERLAIRDKWQGTVSDDLVITRSLLAEGLGIAFVPQALVVSFENRTLSEMLEFTTRQIKVTRAYTPHYWLISLLGSGLFLAVMAASIYWLFARSRTAAVAGAATLALVSALSAAKSYIRLKAIRLALPEWDERLRRQIGTHITLFLVTPLLFFYNGLAALFSRRITWRGITYVLKSPTETVIIRPDVGDRT
ncbi:MAG: glycosyltransferase [Chloracidobacterium sp.]|nr:glycosyltransferase [Chloracidobacterium sp.]MCO5333775.1 glycosyltransferase [Pyrinomonadaceae bacterium]